MTAEEFEFDAKDEMIQEILSPMADFFNEEGFRVSVLSNTGIELPEGKDIEDVLMKLNFTQLKKIVDLQKIIF